MLTVSVFLLFALLMVNGLPVMRLSDHDFLQLVVLGCSILDSF
jgi:hypothetical protein